MSGAKKTYVKHRHPTKKKQRFPKKTVGVLPHPVFSNVSKKKRGETNIGETLFNGGN